MEIVGFFMLLLLVIDDIVRIFKDDEKFDGAMLFARPIVAFLGTSLCGASLGVALLWSAGWGFGGFITAMLISECVGDFNHSDLNTQLEYAAPLGTLPFTLLLPPVPSLLR